MAEAIIADVCNFVPNNRKPVYGVGINDFPLPVRSQGRTLKSYAAWHAMLRRCYAAEWVSKYKSYDGCYVTEEWHSFSTFEKWFTENYFSGAQLDKDLLIKGNKNYSPATCLFVSQSLNKLLGSSASSRGLYPLGVSAHGSGFLANVSVNSSRIGLGKFPTQLLAHQAWQRAKINAIVSFRATDPRIRAALDLRVAQLQDDLLHSRITEKL